MLILGRALLTLAVIGTAASTLRAYPHQLAYFNEITGGPYNGYKHLLGSNFDWGQDLLTMNELGGAEQLLLVGESANSAVALIKGRSCTTLAEAGPYGAFRKQIWRKCSRDTCLLASGAFCLNRSDA